MLEFQYVIHDTSDSFLKELPLKRRNRVKLITLTDKDGKVISYKVTKKIDNETKASLKIFGMTSINAEKM